MSAHIRGFDGLRAVAILSVLVWHTHTLLGFPVERMGPLGALVTTGWAGVDLFFALSGFLITTLLLREERARGRFSLGGFYARRALRILPAFYAVYLVNVLVLSHVWYARSAALHDPPASALVAFGAFFTNYYLYYVHPLRVGAGYLLYWSLCVEEHFYLAWPLVLSRLRGPRARIAVAAVVCAGLPLGRLLVRASGGERPMTVHFVSHYRLDAILVGALAALLFGPLAAHPRARRLALGVAATAVVALVLAGALTVLPPPTVLGQSLGYSLLAVACALVVAEVAAAPSTWLVRALEWPPFVALGRVSYGMYLVHLAGLDFARRLLAISDVEAPVLRPIALLVVGGVLSFGLAQLLYRAVERPFLRWKARFTADTAASPPAASPAPAPPERARGR